MTANLAQPRISSCRAEGQAPASPRQAAGPAAARGLTADAEAEANVLLARISTEKITRYHPELADHLGAVIQTVASPDHRVEPQALPGPRQVLPPQRWPKPLVAGSRSYEQQPAWIIAALANRKAQAMEAVNIRIGPLQFDSADYDVLYLRVGTPGPGREGRLIMTVPETVEATGEDLAPALQAA